jgi:hypothetical protein
MPCAGQKGAESPGDQQEREGGGEPHQWLWSVSPRPTHPAPRPSQVRRMGVVPRSFLVPSHHPADSR